MESSSSSKKLKPTTIFPAKVCITNRSNYHQFVKRRPKVLKKVEIEKSSTAGWGFTNYHLQNLPILLKIFKSIKYAHKLDLRKLSLYNRAISQPKIIYFAKRMAYSRSIITQDTNKPLLDYFFGITEPWIKYTKRATFYGYFPQFYVNGQNADQPLTWNFPYYLQRQPYLKDLAICFDYFSMTYLLQDLFLKKYAVTLERLSLQGLHFERPLPTSFDRFKNLKHLDLQFYNQCQGKSLDITLNLPENLQSLSLSWPGFYTSELISTFPTIKTLKNLTQLKLSSVYGSIKDPLVILDCFYDCPIQDLTLIFTIGSSKLLVSLIHFLKKLSNLESLKLKIQPQDPYWDSPEIKEVLQVIDNLPMLKNLFFSDNWEKKKYHFPPLSSIFTKIFTKPIPLESFRIEIKPINSANQDFLFLIESLRPFASTLKKLRIDIGEYKPNKDEFETVLSFIRSLENIRSLRLGSLSIPVRQFFIDLVQIIHKMPYLRTFSIGEVKGVITKPKFMDIVEEILKKRGLKTFDCKVSKDFKNVLETRHKSSPEINLVEVRKKNPWLVKLPAIRIFVGDRKGEQANWVQKD